MKLTVIILLQTPFSLRDYNRFGIDDLQRNGFDVQVWELSPILGLSYAEPPERAKFINHHLFSCKSEIKAALEKLNSQTYVINYINYSYKTYFLYKWLAKYKFPYCVVSAGMLPISMAKPYAFFWQKIKKLSIKKLVNKIFLFIPCSWLGIEYASYSILGGQLSSHAVSMSNANTKQIKAHSFDYDIYLKSVADVRTQPLQEYIVFLDEYVPFHPDFAYLGIKPPADAETYYAELNIFFDHLESLTGFRVLIAAHPRSDYAQHPDYFAGREVVRGKTIELVQQSSLILLHSSTAVNFAIMYNKPLLFLNSSSYADHHLARSISLMALALNNERVVDLKKPESYLKLARNDLFEVNLELYQNYKHNYIKSAESPEMLLWDIFSQTIRMN